MSFLKRGLLVALGVAPAYAGVIMPSLQRVMRESREGEPIRVLVHLKAKPEYRVNKTTAEKRAFIAYLKDFARRTQAPVIDYAKALGVKNIKSYWVFNGFYCEATPAQIRALAAREDVEYIIEDFVVKLDDTKPVPADAIKAVAWGVSKIEADRVWTELGYDGSGITVANMDTGVDVSHPALADKWRSDQGWYDAVNGQSSPYDDHGHGTHTMGTICGGDGPGPFSEDIGVAPGAQFIAVKIFDAYGSGYASWIHSGFQWIADLANNGMEPDLVSNSWGSTATTSTEYWDDVMTWRSLDIIPVFSIGNSGPSPNTAGTPGNFPTVIGVGATDSNDDIADFSSRGPAPNQDPWNDQSYWLRGDWNLIKPDISAPGVNVYSAAPGGGYQYMSGTSMACPHVAGVVALMLSKNPTIDIYTIYDIILNTADQPSQGSPYPNNNYGWGRINAYNAVDAVPTTDVPNVTVYSTQLEVQNDNGNGIWDPGEAANIIVTLRNTGVDVQNVQGVMSGSDQYVTLTDSVSNYGNMPQGSQADNSSDPYKASASASTECGYEKTFNLHITGTNPNYETDRSLSFTIGTELGYTYNSFAGPGDSANYIYGVAYDPDRNVLWVGYFQNDNTLYKLDPDDGSQLGTLNLPSGTQVGGIAYDPNRGIWVHDNANKMLYLIDPESGSVLQEFSSPATQYPTGVAYDWNEDALWVVDRDANTIYKVDPDNGSTLDQFSVPVSGTYGPRGLLYEPRGNGGTGTLVLMFTDFSSGYLDSTVMYELTRSGSLTGNKYNFGAKNYRGLSLDTRNGLYFVAGMSSHQVLEIGGFYCTPVYDVSEGPSLLTTELRGPWPSVTRGPVSFALALPSAALVEVKLYDAAGRLAERVFAGRLEAGVHAFHAELNSAPGTYYLVVRVNGVGFTRRLVITR